MSGSLLSPSRPPAAPPSAWGRFIVEPDYEGLDAETRAKAMAVDRRANWIAGIVLVIAALVGLVLIAANLLVQWTYLSTLICLMGGSASVLRAWWVPQAVDIRKLRRIGLAMVLAFYVLPFGVLVVRLWDAGAPNWSHVWQAFLLLPTWPILLFLPIGILLELIVATSRRKQVQRELERTQLEAERDAAARQAAEASLQLLRAQIQPHFIFNTLAALQHWVDTGDARAPGLLRALTSFLRGSTELLANEQVMLADELVLAQHYLAIMQVRLGERLQSRFDVDEASRLQTLPPGLLLTLLENAVEHGVAPALHPAEVLVRARREGSRFALVVQNSGQPLVADWRAGLGLTNCRERLRHRFGPAARLSLRATDEGTLAQVVIHG